MVQNVRGPDGRVHAFPDSASPDQIKSAMDQVYSDTVRAEREAERERGVTRDATGNERLMSYDEFSGRGRTAQENFSQMEAERQAAEEGSLGSDLFGMPDRQMLQDWAGAVGGTAGSVLGPSAVASATRGAKAGFTVGRHAGPVGAAVGTIGGGALGAGLFYGAAAFGLNPDEPAENTLVEAANYAKEDAMWSMGFMSATPIFMRNVVGPLAGLNNDQAREVTRLAARFEPVDPKAFNRSVDQAEEALQAAREGGEQATRGFNVPTYLAAQSSLARGFPNVAGVFPFAGAPLRRQMQETGEGMTRELRQMLDINAPNVNLWSLGVDVERAAQRATNTFNQAAAAKYKAVEDHVEGLGNPQIIPVDRIHQTANRVLEGSSDLRVRETGETSNLRITDIQDGSRVTDYSRITQTPSGRTRGVEGQRRATPEGGARGRRSVTGDEATTTTTRPMRRITNTRVRDFFSELRNLEGPISYQGWQDIMDDTRALLRDREIKGNDARALIELKRDMEESVMASVDPEFNRLYQEANQFYTQYMARDTGVFRSPALTPFKKSDERLFGRQRQEISRIRQSQPDQLAKQLINNTNPQNIRDIRRAVGEEGMRPIREAYFREAYQNSFRNRTGSDIITGEIDENAGQVFDFTKFAQNLGLMTRENREVLEELTRGSNIDMSRLEDFVNLSTRVGSVKLTEANTFVKRRLVLGGLGAFTAYSGGLFTMAGAATALLVANNLTRVLSSPRLMRNYERLINPETTDSVKRSAMGSLWNAYSYEEVLQTFNISQQEIEQAREGRTQLEYRREREGYERRAR